MCNTHGAARYCFGPASVRWCVPHTVNVSLSNQNWMELWRSPQVPRYLMPRLAVEMRTFQGLVEVGFPAHKMEKWVRRNVVSTIEPVMRSSMVLICWENPNRRYDDLVYYTYIRTTLDELNYTNSLDELRQTDWNAHQLRFICRLILALACDWLLFGGLSIVRHYVSS